MSQITRETKNELMNYRRLVRVLQVVRILLMKVVVYRRKFHERSNRAAVCGWMLVTESA